jgi:Zn-finger nucleic acid-binding protein
MKCPSCSGCLEEQRLHEIVVDVCNKCKGIWFDRTELQSYCRRTNRGPAREGRAGLQFLPYGEVEPEQCPRCQGESLQIGDLGDHTLLRCSNCVGVFVPNPELERMKESWSIRVAPPQPVTDDHGWLGYIICYVLSDLVFNVMTDL